MKKTIKVLAISIGLVLGTVSTQISAHAVTNNATVRPVLKNPIMNTSSIVGFKIIKVLVQDNTDPKSGVAVSDRLAIRIRNTTAKTINSFEIFYTMVDQVTKRSESYYQKLTNFSIPANSMGYLDFDNSKGIGHFPENKYSIYRNSKNKVTFTIELSATGFKPMYATAVKAKGTTEDPNA